MALGPTQSGLAHVTLEAVADVDLSRSRHARDLVRREVDDDLATSGAVGRQLDGVRDALLRTHSFPANNGCSVTSSLTLDYFTMVPNLINKLVKRDYLKTCAAH